MRSKLIVLGLVIAGLAFPAGLVHALRIAPPPGPVRIVNSDAVFVGRVDEFEPVDVDAKQFPGAKETVKFRIATVKVTEVIRGLKDEKTIRVGFVPFVAPKPGVPITGRGRGPELTVGQEGLFMISKHADGKFYLVPDFGYFVSSKDKAFDAEVKTAKKVVKIMADSTSALKSKDEDERLMAASILVSKYRTPKGQFPFKEEPIDAEESKLILGVIASSKWTVARFGDPNPQQLFFQLGITAKDGWMPPKKITSPDDMRNAVQAWIRDHGEYRIKRYVSSSDR
jgi:hypothetical protein